MAERKRMTGSYQRDLKRWGEIIRADHLVSRNDNWAGVRGYRNAVNIKVLWRSIIASVPVRNKAHHEARKAFKWFCGSRKIQKIYSDNSGELKAAAEKLGVPHEGSQPGVPFSNAIAERNNQDILAMTNTAFCAARFPA
jgi:hypothetical protein